MKQGPAVRPTISHPRATRSPFAGIALSPLADLRAAAREVSPESKNIYTPKRTIPLPASCSQLVFAYNEERLLAGLENGRILVFDARALFREGPNEAAPLADHFTRAGPPRQVTPNPSTDAGLAELVAIVTHDGFALILDVTKGMQGGWQSEEGQPRISAGACISYS